MKWPLTEGRDLIKEVPSSPLLLNSADHLPLWISKENSVLLGGLWIGNKRLEKPELVETPGDSEGPG